jgi:TRAP transporter TAXI family solute receptor
MNRNRRWPWFLGALVLASALAGAIAFTVHRSRPPLVRLAAGSPQTESYKLAEAIRDVLKLRGSVQIEVVETAGSAQSMAELEAGRVDMILAQADAKPCAPARLVAKMFPEDFQLIAREDSGIADFADVRGKRIGLATVGSGQHSSFWFLAQHYDIAEGEITEVNGRDRELDEMFIRGELDAVFRVRPPQNAAIQRLVREGNGVLIPIDQGGAIGLKQAALEKSLIPKGAYQGAPPMPAEDLPTVSAPRLMFARASTDASIVRTVCAALYEQRHDLVELMPLASFISPPGEGTPALVPLHEGARAYYDREKPNFFQENADYLALILTVVLGLASWLWGLKRRFEQARKHRADKHNLELTELMGSAMKAQSAEEIAEIRNRLVMIFQHVVQEMDRGRLDGESLQSFALVWNAAAHSVRDRETALVKR